MSGELPLPAFRFLDQPPSLWRMVRHGIGDVGSCIPDSILDQFAVQLPGRGAPLVVSHPDLAREILNDRAALFERDTFIRRLFRRAWGRGLAGAEGADWQRQRRAVSPFFRPSAVASQLRSFAHEADRFTQDLPDSGAIDLKRAALDIIAGVVFSVVVEARGAVDRAAVARDVPAYIARIAGFGPLDLLPLPEAWLDLLAGVDRDPAVRRIRTAAALLAADRTSGPARTDMIALLEPEGPIPDNIGGLIPAAMDTTVHALAWALHTLARRPAWQDRLAQESVAAGPEPSLAQLPLTRCVVQEVLRLYPPAPLLARSAAVAQEIAGFPVRRGQTVLIAAYAMHRHPGLWDQPGGFDPERFLPERGLHDAYLPFGTGPRMCVAAQFAQAELAVVLARLLRQLEFLPDGSEPEVSLRITTCSRNGLTAQFRRRDTGLSSKPN